jgi:hypothetical protein
MAKGHAQGNIMRPLQSQRINSLNQKMGTATLMSALLFTPGISTASLHGDTNAVLAAEGAQPERETAQVSFDRTPGAALVRFGSQSSDQLANHVMELPEILSQILRSQDPLPAVSKAFTTSGPLLSGALTNLNGAKTIPEFSALAAQIQGESPSNSSSIVTALRTKGAMIAGVISYKIDDGLKEIERLDVVQLTPERISTEMISCKRNLKRTAPLQVSCSQVSFGDGISGFDVSDGLVQIRVLYCPESALPRGPEAVAARNHLFRSDHPVESNRVDLVSHVQDRCVPIFKALGSAQRFDDFSGALLAFVDLLPPGRHPTFKVSAGVDQVIGELFDENGVRVVDLNGLFDLGRISTTRTGTIPPIRDGWSILPK